MNHTLTEADKKTEMTDAEIKELAIKCGGTILESYTSTSEGNTTALLLTMRELNSFAKEIEAITREKVLAELREQKPFKYMYTYKGIVYPHEVSTDAEPFPLYAQPMPPVPEGWRLVPIEPTVEIFYALRVGSRKDNPSDELCRLRYAALLAALLAAPKKGK